MDLLSIIAELRKERDAVEAVILQMERLAGTQRKRRGRPPAFLAELTKTRKPFSEETRKKMAASQKKRWAAQRKSSEA